MNITTSLKQIVTDKASPLEKLIKQSNQLGLLTQLMQNKLANELSQHCQVAKYSKKILVLAVDNASWATQIRYHAPDLIESLKTLPEFNKLTAIKCFVQPKTINKVVKKAERSKQDQKQAGTLRKFAENVKRR
jgi:hypothetical protein